MLLMIVFVLAFAGGADVAVAVAIGEVVTVGSGRGHYSEYCRCRCCSCRSPSCRHRSYRSVFLGTILALERIDMLVLSNQLCGVGAVLSERSCGRRSCIRWCLSPLERSLQCWS